jgi:hypothetical protein
MSDFFKVINFDNVKGAVKPSRYRNSHKDLLQHPASVLIVAKSGMGKTNLLMNILTKWSCWDRIILVSPHIDQPKYQTLIKFYEKVEKRCGDDILEVYTTIEEAPTHEDLEDTDELQTAIVFDDVIMSKDLTEVENWFVKNRHSNTSVFFLTQSYTKKTPIVIRQNANYHIFLKTPSRKNQSLIYQELGYNTTKDRFLQMFNDATQGFNFFMIDLKTIDPLKQYRKNWTHFYDPN